MKLGVVGTGSVGCAIALAAVTRGSARDIVLVNRTRKTAEAVATDMRCGKPPGPKVDLSDGDYDPFSGLGQGLADLRSFGRPLVGASAARALLRSAARRSTGRPYFFRTSAKASSANS
jgi:hypothetical protein